MAKKKTGVGADVPSYTPEEFDLKLKALGCYIFPQTMFIDTGGRWVASKTNDRFYDEVAYITTIPTGLQLVLGKIFGFIGVDLKISELSKPDTIIRKEGNTYYCFAKDCVIMTRVK